MSNLMQGTPFHNEGDARFLTNEHVRTVAVAKPATDWTSGALKSRRWNVTGRIYAHHDSHGFTYEVRHDDDGSIGHYEPRELRSISRPDPKPFVNMETGERLTGSEVAAREFPIRVPTPEEEGQERGHAQASVDEDDPASNNSSVAWARKILRAYALVDALRKKLEPAEGKWEKVNGEADRLRVPGGWLYRTQAYQATTHYENFPNEYKVTAESTTFVPDTVVP